MLQPCRFVLHYYTSEHLHLIWSTRWFTTLEHFSDILVSLTALWVLSCWVICVKWKWVYRRRSEMVNKYGTVKKVSLLVIKMTHWVCARFMVLENNMHSELSVGFSAFCGFQFKLQSKQEAANVQRHWKRGVSVAEEPLTWDKLHRNSVLLILFLGVLQSSLHMKKGERREQTLLSLSAITWTGCYDRGLEQRERIVVQGVVL